MPQPFENAVMTNAGIKLLNEAQNGECKIEFTRIAVGDGIYSDKTGDTLAQLTELKNEKRSYTIASKEKVNDNAIILQTLISNYDEVEEVTLITEGFYINEIAVFARAVDSDNEIMYSLAVTAGETGDYMPAYNGFNPAQIIQSYLVSVNNASDVKIVVRNEAYALQEDVNKMQENVDVVKNGIDEIFAWLQEELLNTDTIETAFNNTFSHAPDTTVTEDPTALTSEDIENALNTEWNGGSSSDSTAMSAEDVENATNTEWNGESSEDPTALTAEEIEEATS